MTCQFCGPNFVGVCQHGSPASLTPSTAPKKASMNVIKEKLDLLSKFMTNEKHYAFKQGAEFAVDEIIMFLVSDGEYTTNYDWVSEIIKRFK